MINLFLSNTDSNHFNSREHPFPRSEQSPNCEIQRANWWYQNGLRSWDPTDSDTSQGQQPKGQVLIDFIIDFTPGATEQADLLKGWIMNVEGASNSKGAGIRIVFTTPEGSIIEQSFTFGFPASNNEVEYEAVLAGSERPSYSGSHDSKFSATPRW